MSLLDLVSQEGHLPERAELEVAERELEANHLFLLDCLRFYGEHSVQAMAAYDAYLEAKNKLETVQAELMLAIISYRSAMALELAEAVFRRRTRFPSEVFQGVPLAFHLV